MKNIGLLGGTFDPIHNGHLIIAEYLRDELDLDEIWFIPVKVHPLKNNESIASADSRLTMLDLALKDNAYFKSCDIELKKDGISYTIDTINLLLTQYSCISPKFFFFTGMDNVNDLHRWKDPFQLLTRCQIVAFGRPGFKPDEAVKIYLPYIKFVHVPRLEISSTDIRNRIQNKRSVRYLVPDAVLAYIEKEQLYK